MNQGVLFRLISGKIRNIESLIHFIGLILANFFIFI